MTDFKNEKNFSTQRKPEQASLSDYDRDELLKDVHRLLGLIADKLCGPTVLGGRADGILEYRFPSGRIEYNNTNAPPSRRYP
jgi:hypothetical protein